MSTRWVSHIICLGPLTCMACIPDNHIRNLIIRVYHSFLEKNRETFNLSQISWIVVGKKACDELFIDIFCTERRLAYIQMIFLDLTSINQLTRGGGGEAGLRSSFTIVRLIVRQSIVRRQTRASRDYWCFTRKQK